MTITQETLSVSGITLSKLYGRQEAETARFGEANRRQAADPDSYPSNTFFKFVSITPQFFSE